MTSRKRRLVVESDDAERRNSMKRELAHGIDITHSSLSSVKKKE